MVVYYVVENQGRAAMTTLVVTDMRDTVVIRINSVGHANRELPPPPTLLLLFNYSSLTLLPFIPLFTFFFSYLYILSPRLSSALHLTSSNSS